LRENEKIEPMAREIDELREIEAMLRETVSGLEERVESLSAELVKREEEYRQKIEEMEQSFAAQIAELKIAHMEEIDLCCRIHAAGYRVVVVPDAMVFHVGGASLSQGNPKKTYLNFRNNLLLLHKNMPVKQGRVKLFVRRLYDTLAWGMFLLKFDFKNANAVLKAHNDFRKMKKLYTEHPDINVLASLPGAKRNIIIDYYLKRMKK
jgi:DNA-binding transcriptional MerR regulator